jgi:hypothetical protein
VAADLVGSARVSAAQHRVLVALCRPLKDASGYVTPATNQQIADELFVSVDAVKVHLRGLFAKFGIEDLLQNPERARLANSRSRAAWSHRVICERRSPRPLSGRPVDRRER